MSSVIVVGGGAVGLCVAEALATRGAEVTLFERARCGEAASAGNAGWVTPSLSIPVPGPGVISESLRWLIDPSGPLWIRPTLSPAVLGWIARFLAKCRRSAYRRGLAALQLAASAAGEAFDRLAGRGIEFEMHSEPLLYPAFDRDELEHLVDLARQLCSAGARAPLEQLDGAQIRELEPALDARVLGGILAHGERRVRPEAFLASMRAALAGRGATIREGVAVTALRSERGRWIAHASGAEHRADAVVLANGVDACELLAPLGLRLPVLAAKGYSRTYRPDPSGPRRPLYLEKPKVAVSVYDEGTRVSGTLELGARDLSLSRRRLAAITTAAREAMPGWRMPGDPSDWAGMRSLSPDGMPYLGALDGRDGLLVATAHSTLGITLAPLSGELIAELVLERRRSPVLEAFDPARALGRRAPSQTQEGLR